ncbi:class I SAM-dependent methyltransferase [Brevibacterium album]|uniref:class I SAM-dependent methyltransferase n=1 Tax=Brevibacterium album TaxID=417948 RepID=UPI000427D35A|nr:class I SAM-dependent methyltransferase [Brevibacterium album]
MDDPYAATASAYDLFAHPYRRPCESALGEILPRLRHDHGPVLDIGAGSGANAAFVLEHAPEARIVALEPSRSMRSLALGRIAEHPEWHTRITVRPEDFLEATLPARLGGALAIGVLGHFDAGERTGVLAELAARLPRGGVALLDLQEPAHPRRVEPCEFTAAQIGEIAYRGIAEAWPVGEEAMRWRMTYLSLEDERVLTEETVEHVYHHPSPERFAAEAAEAGFTVHRFRDTVLRILERR